MPLQVNVEIGNVNTEEKLQANIVLDWHPYFKAFESLFVLVHNRFGHHDTVPNITEWNAACRELWLYMVTSTKQCHVLFLCVCVLILKRGLVKTLTLYLLMWRI
jgi:hypothetical protein